MRESCTFFIHFSKMFGIIMRFHTEIKNEHRFSVYNSILMKIGEVHLHGCSDKLFLENYPTPMGTCPNPHFCPEIQEKIDKFHEKILRKKSQRSESLQIETSLQMNYHNHLSCRKILILFTWFDKLKNIYIWNFWNFWKIHKFSKF